MGMSVGNRCEAAPEKQANTKQNAKQTRIETISNANRDADPAGRITHKAAHGGAARPAFPRPSLFRQASAATQPSAKTAEAARQGPRGIFSYGMQGHPVAPGPNYPRDL